MNKNPVLSPSLIPRRSPAAAESHARRHDHRHAQITAEICHSQFIPSPRLHSHLMKALKILVLASLAMGAAFIVGWQVSVGRRVVAIVTPHLAGLSRAKESAVGPGAGLAAAGGTPSGPTASGAKIDEAGTALAAALDVVTSPQSSFCAAIRN